MPHVPFNRPPATGSEERYLLEALRNAHLSTDGPFGERCSRWLEKRTGTRRALLTHSCTAALEMCAFLLEIAPGDEVVMPSFTFPSTANAFAVRGGVPVFVDIRPDTLNLDETRIEDAITARTRAIVAVHYAGVPCEMDAIAAVAARHRIGVVEDAAQALLSKCHGRPAGALADLAALSFHETKNVVAGEGGALLLRGGDFVSRAEIIRQKGTDRSRFFRGEVDRYTWVELGSSYGLSDLNAAFLWAQLEHADELTAARRRTWNLYHDAFADLERRELVRRPIIPEHVEHNAHLYYLLLPTARDRARVLADLAQRDVNAVFHYVPLHLSAAGRRFARVAGSLTVTENAADCLIRLPLWSGLPDEDALRVVEEVRSAVALRV